MENREPFKLKGIILAYNLFQTLFRFSTQSNIRENTSTILFYAMLISKIYLVITSIIKFSSPQCMGL